MGEWTLFSNHGHVLVCLANNNEARLRDVAAAVGITERAVQNIIRELQDSGMVQISKHGRCNRYQINHRKSLRHPLEAHCTVGKLLQLVKSREAETEDSETRESVPTRTAKSAESRKPPTRLKPTAVPQPVKDKSEWPDPLKDVAAPKQTPEPEAVSVSQKTQELNTTENSSEAEVPEAKPAKAAEVKVAEVNKASAQPSKAEEKPVETPVEEAKPAADSTDDKKEKAKKKKDEKKVPPSSQQGSLF